MVSCILPPSWRLPPVRGTAAASGLAEQGLMSDVVLPEKRKVGSSTLPLTTSFEPVYSALTSTNAG